MARAAQGARPMQHAKNSTRPDRAGKRYLGHHEEPATYRRAKILTAKLGWTMDALLRFALYDALEKLEAQADEEDSN